jgi:Rad3-related DNA helicase
VSEKTYIDDVFGEAGLLGQVFSGYKPREGQVEMVRAVDRAIVERRAALVEAPTGTGKSLAYLVPAIWHTTAGKDALLDARPASAQIRASGSEPRALVVTANIALQDQLIAKDVPLLQRLLPWPFTAAVAKGRSNWACLDRLDGARAEVEAKGGPLQVFKNKQLADQWQEILRWSRVTENGDLSELPFEIEGRMLRPRVSTSAEDCLGKSCLSYGPCFAEKSKLAWHDANIIVTNYHLLFAHLTIGAGNILPFFDILILDECFVAGTMVGNKPIEQIKVGDSVPSYDEETGTLVERKVRRLFVSKPHALVRVRLGERTLTCTPGHPFLTQRGWVPAISLNVSDIVLSSKERCVSSWTRVDGVEILERTGDGTFGGACPDGLVYNLEVEGTHTYLVDGLVVHNCHELSDIAREFLGSRVTPGSVRYAGRLLAPPPARLAKTNLRVIDKDLQQNLYETSGHFFLRMEETFFSDERTRGDTPKDEPDRVRQTIEGVPDVLFEVPGATHAPAAVSEARVRIPKPGMVDAAPLVDLLRKTAARYEEEEGRFRTRGEHADETELEGPEADMLFKARERVLDLATDIERAVALTDAFKNVYFVEHGADGNPKSMTLGSLPVEVGPLLKAIIFENDELVTIATSATLSTARSDGGGKLDFFVRQVGAWKASRLVVDSPFNLKRQARLVVPWNAPEPKDLRAFEQGIGRLAVQAIEQAHGRTLGLFASRKRLNIVADLVRQKLGNKYLVMTQGEAPRPQLIARFKADISSVLLGTKSFWAGVDVPGEALSLVIIDRIPFPAKDDPILSWLEEAMARDLADPARDPQKKKPNVFYDWILPRATIDLRQGVGRLIRAAGDRGVAVILDSRLVNAKYGPRVIEALGLGDAMQNITDVGDFLDGRT